MKRALAGVLLVAALLQFVNLEAQSLWIDELATVRLGAAPTLEDFWFDYDRERQPPLHHLLLYGWLRFAGTSDASVRVPFAFMSVVSVGLMYWLGTLLGDRRRGLIAAALMAISPFLLLYGRMARYFAPAVLFTLASTIALVIALRQGKSGKRGLVAWGFYILFALVSLMTNYPGAAVLAVQNLLVILWLWFPSGARRDLAEERLWRMRSGWFMSQLVTLVLFGLWIASEWEHITGFPGERRPFEVPSGRRFVLGLIYPFHSYGLGETIYPWHPAALIGGAAIAIGLFLGVRRLRGRDWVERMPLVVFVGTMVVMSAAFETFFQDLASTGIPSKAVGAFPFFILLAAEGLESIRRLRLPILVAVVIASFFGSWNYFKGSQFHNQSMSIPKREIAADLAKVPSGDLIVSDDDLDLQYYYRPTSESAEIIFLRRRLVSVLSQVQRERFESLWLVTQGRDGTRGRAQSSRNELESWLNENYELTLTRGYQRQDPTYMRFKELLSGFPSYQYRVTVQRFEPR